jgi:hypothetical protein
VRWNRISQDLHKRVKEFVNAKQVRMIARWKETHAAGFCEKRVSPGPVLCRASELFSPSAAVLFKGETTATANVSNTNRPSAFRDFSAASRMRRAVRSAPV